MKIFAFVLVVVSVTYAQRNVLRPPSASAQIDWNASVNDSSALNLVDKQNRFSNASYIFDLLSNAEKKISDEIWYEAHVGMADYYDAQIKDDTKAFTLGFRLNLSNPKIPQPKQIRAQINEIRNRLRYYPYSFSKEITKQLSEMEKRLDSYEQEFWWKRFSLGVLFPFQFLSYGSRENWDYKRTTPYLGVDLGDRASINFGYSIEGDLVFGVSIDISTPVYLFSTSFFEKLRPISGVGEYNSRIVY